MADVAAPRSSSSAARPAAAGRGRRRRQVAQSVRPGRTAALTSRKQLRILLVDDHAIVRRGIRQLIDIQDDMTVVAEAADGREAVAMADQVRPDLIVMDLAMPGMSGIEATRVVHAANPTTRVLILTMHEDRGCLREVLDAGAAGYLLKRAAAEEIVDAIRTVSAGSAFVDSRITNELMNLFVAPATRHVAADASELTPRELETLRYIAEGYANKEIGARLELSVKSVETYKARAMKKLGLASRVDIVRLARDRRWPPIG